jgi:hypothetical protein
MDQQRGGVYFLLGGILLILCRGPVLDFYKAIYKLFGYDSLPLRSIKVVILILGIILGTLGILILLNIAHLK